MIEKNTNLIKDPKIKRTIEYDPNAKQVNILDTRFYRRNNKYYPSVTQILNYFPKNQFFHSWLKDVGHNSEIIAQKAAKEGTAVHNTVEQLLNGEEINWLDEYGNAKYNLDVWRMILRFADFWNTHKPKLIAVEYHLFSDQYQFAGTADIVCEFQDKKWILDIKTSNSLHTAHELQLAAYAQAWNETHDTPVEKTGIIWLKSPTRKASNKAIQGNGWAFKTFDREIAESFSLFQKIQDIYKIENPEFKPVTETLPISVKLQ
jgi:hypothetical protein